MNPFISSNYDPGIEWEFGDAPIDNNLNPSDSRCSGMVRWSGDRGTQRAVLGRCKKTPNTFFLVHLQPGPHVQSGSLWSRNRVQGVFVKSLHREFCFMDVTQVTRNLLGDVLQAAASRFPCILPAMTPLFPILAAAK